MDHEIELKFRVGGHASLRERLLRLDARYAGTAVLTDRFFDTPERTLFSSGCGLRLRHFRPEGEAASAAPDAPPRALLTFKGPRLPSRQAKIRPEHETTVQSPQALCEILAGLGYRPVLTVQKRRATYHLGDCEVALDELPLLGCFVEIEGPGERAVHALAERLGLTGEHILDSYVRLLADYCRQNDLPFEEITFERYGRL